RLGAADMSKTTLRFSRNLIPDPQMLVGKRIHIHKLLPLDPPVPDPRAAEFVLNWYAWITSVETTTDAIVAKYEDKKVRPSDFLRLKLNETTSFDITGSRMLQPETLREIEAFEEFIRARTSDAVGGVLGPADYIATVSYMRTGRKETGRAVPADV